MAVPTSARLIRFRRGALDGDQAASSAAGRTAAATSAYQTTLRTASSPNTAESQRASCSNSVSAERERVASQRPPSAIDEEKGLPAEGRGRPLRDRLGERRVVEDAAVVAGQGEAVGRDEEAGPRQDGEGARPPPEPTAAAACGYRSPRASGRSGSRDRRRPRPSRAGSPTGRAAGRRGTRGGRADECPRGGARAGERTRGTSRSVPGSPCAARPVAYPNATMIATLRSEAPRCRAAAAVTMKAAR